MKKSKMAVNEWLPIPAVPPNHLHTTICTYPGYLPRTCLPTSYPATYILVHTRSSRGPDEPSRTDVMDGYERMLPILCNHPHRLTIVARPGRLGRLAHPSRWGPRHLSPGSPCLAPAAKPKRPIHYSRHPSMAIHGGLRSGYLPTLLPYRLFMASMAVLGWPLSTPQPPIRSFFQPPAHPVPPTARPAWLPGIRTRP